MKREDMQINNVVLTIMQDEKVKKYMDKLREYDMETYRHSINVAYIVTKIMPLMVKNRLIEKSYIYQLIMAALLHDIGKITVPISVLRKIEPLNKRDIAYIHQHPLNGVDILSEKEFPAMVYDAILKHHEKLDGSGYPCGYSMHEIANDTRIITVADIYCALSERRCYKQSLGTEQIFDIMEKDVQNNLIDADIYVALRTSLGTDYQDTIKIII